ncbi:hypothetical protein KOW79_021216 [Hemibagrus wyckioides]|uniref:Uncharacterized protein n=1 Tax=Hemibagrus wyckioides TaxID=337641 RepID=A0A9D3N2G4_9TELE|nr:hypothetical protein KOW79_021216 [Hemibagrus wyckioides]
MSWRPAAPSPQLSQISEFRVQGEIRGSGAGVEIVPDRMGPPVRHPALRNLKAYGFKRTGLEADESGGFISAPFHRHGIQTKPWLQFDSSTEDVLKFDRETRNGCFAPYSVAFHSA